MSIVNAPRETYARGMSRLQSKNAICKYCGGEMIWKWSTYHMKNKPYTPDGKRYHECIKETDSIKVIKMSPAEIEREYGKAEKPGRAYA